MKIHEYQGKQIFAKYGVPVPKGYPAFTVDEAEAAAKKLIAETGNQVTVVKAQIHAGGRGKGGGVKVAKGGEADARKLAEQILGMQLITIQTGPEGQKVRRLYIEQGLDIAKEYYLGAVLDRDKRRVARAGEPVDLGPTEYRLLEFFLEHPGRVFSRERYLGAIASAPFYARWELGPIETRLSAEMALLRYPATLTFPSGRVVVCWHTDSYERRGDAWLAVWSQATEIAPPMADQRAIALVRPAPDHRAVISDKVVG